MGEVPLYRGRDGVCNPEIRAQVHAEMCSGSEAGSHLRLEDFVYHSTLGLRVIKKKKTRSCLSVYTTTTSSQGDTKRRASSSYRGTSLIRNHRILGPYSRPMPRALPWS